MLISTSRLHIVGASVFANQSLRPRESLLPLFSLLTHPRDTILAYPSDLPTSQSMAD